MRQEEPTPEQEQADAPPTNPPAEVAADDAGDAAAAEQAHQDAEAGQDTPAATSGE